jgi:hypothetical protein
MFEKSERKCIKVKKRVQQNVKKDLKMFKKSARKCIKVKKGSAAKCFFSKKIKNKNRSVRSLCGLWAYQASVASH